MSSDLSCWLSRTAIVNVLVVGANVVGGEEKQVSIRASHVLRREQGEWKIIETHTDKLSFLANND